MAASGDFDATEIAGTRRGRDDDPAAAVKEAEQTLRRHTALVNAWSAVCTQLSVYKYAPIPLPAEWAADTDFSACNMLLALVSNGTRDANEAKQDAEKAYERAKRAFERAKEAKAAPLSPPDVAELCTQIKVKMNELRRTGTAPKVLATAPFHRSSEAALEHEPGFANVQGRDDIAQAVLKGCDVLRHIKGENIGNGDRRPVMYNGGVTGSGKTVSLLVAAEAAIEECEKMKKTACAVYVTLNNFTNVKEVAAENSDRSIAQVLFIARAFHAVLTALDLPVRDYCTWRSSFNATVFSRNDMLKLKEALGVDYLFLVGDDVASAPNTEAALSALCTLGDADSTFPVTVLLSCYAPWLLPKLFMRSGRGLVPIPTVLAPDVNDLPAVRDHDLLCRYYVLCGGHMRSAARLLRAANEGKTERGVSEAIADVKATARRLALQLVRDAGEAPHEMALGIAAAVCGERFRSIWLTMKNETVAAAVSSLYGATDMKARCVNPLVLMDKDLGTLVEDARTHVSTLPDTSILDVVKCLEQWLAELRCAIDPSSEPNPDLVKGFERLIGAGTALSFAWYRLLNRTVTFSTVFERVKGETKLHPDDGTGLNHLQVTTAPVCLVQDVLDLNAALNTLRPGQYSLFKQENHPTIDLYAYSAPVLSTHQYKLTLHTPDFEGYAKGINGIAGTISAKFPAETSTATGKVPPRAVHLFVTPLKYSPSAKTLKKIKLPKGHYVAAVSAEESSCANLLWCYSCVAHFQSSSTDGARNTLRD